MANFSSNFSAILALAGSAGTGDLAAVLALGNTTGGNDVEFGMGDGIVTTANTGGPGFPLSISAGDAGGAGMFNGGDLVLAAGAGSGGGADGTITLSGNVVITGDFESTTFVTSSGSPEGSLVADVGTIYTRTDGSSGNTLYIKQSGSGTSSGWAPAGPLIVEQQTSTGAPSYMTSRPVFQDTVPLGITNLLVYWNGVLQREGAAFDYTVMYGMASTAITFVVVPPAGDLITITYLPA